jgi:hypothetical protein
VALREGEINLYPDIKPIEVRTVMVKKNEASLEVPNLNNLAGYGGRGTSILSYTLMFIICIISAAIQSFLLIKLKAVILTQEYLHSCMFCPPFLYDQVTPEEPPIPSV